MVGMQGDEAQMSVNQGGRDGKKQTYPKTEESADKKKVRPKTFFITSVW